MLFIIDGAVYAAASPLIGFLLDRSNRSGTRKYIKNEHRVLEPSLCLLGGTATIGLGFAILASPPLILSPSLAQVTYHLVFCLLSQTPQICVGAGLHGLGMSACFIASLTLMTESGGKSLGADQVVFFLLNGITHTPTQQTGCHDHLLVDHC